MVGTEMYSEIQKRKRTGYSQRAVARELDIDRKTVRKYWAMTEDEYARYLLDSKNRVIESISIAIESTGNVSQNTRCMSQYARTGCLASLVWK
ncbi:MAG: hypothetical protein VB111_02865 [Clostridiaceae bacterium]|nr:hypothetical protein [Clostridiaceae bacterium]